ncbi:MAG: M15 family metallopeptidase [Myxococcota bacterium]|nr:M15 family metallopeptidase [Myxococcota bacterium]
MGGSWLVGLGSLLVLGASTGEVLPSAGEAAGATAPGTAAAPPAATPPDLDQPAPKPTWSCREQPPQPFLIRRNYTPRRGMSDAELRACRQRHQDAIRYRSKTYGYFKGFGSPTDNPRTPWQQSTVTTFFGLKVRLHEKVVPALRCVEEELRRTCPATPYQPRQLDGIRPKNSFRGGEVSNHAYGIALDIDRDRNPCCGCGGNLRNHPSCKKPAASIRERTALPDCWIEVFARFGFHWLGDDPLQDTMHFEFLGDPAQVLGPAVP